MNKVMTEWWKSHFDLFEWGSLLIGILGGLLALLLQKRNNLAKAGKSTHHLILCTMLDAAERMYYFLKKQYEAFTGDLKKTSIQTNNKSLEPKNLLWFVEIIPFVLACFASVILFNWLFVIAEKNRFSIPSPLSYENTFLLVLPLAWTVGIAFFQYRIQDRLTLSQKKESDIQKKQEKLHQQVQRKADMISALRSLYSCDVTAINFCTHRALAVVGTDFSYLKSSLDAGYAFRIINRCGDPCFYFPYYQGKEESSPKVTITVQNTDKESDMYPVNSHFCCVRPNQVLIYFPLPLDGPSGSYTVSAVPEYIYHFFLSPTSGEEHIKLTFSIALEVIDPYGNVTPEDSITSDLFKYEISFDVESCGGYSSDGIFPVTLKNYSIHEIRET